MDSKNCGNCIHSAFKNVYVEAVPSIATCMNNKAKHYLDDHIYSYCCEKWEVNVKTTSNR